MIGQGTQRNDVAERVQAVSRTEGGSVYHDPEADEWLLDLPGKGVTLTLDREELLDLLSLVEGARPSLQPATELAPAAGHPFTTASGITFFVTPRPHLKAS